MADGALTDFERTTFTHDGTTRDVFRLGSVPAVIVIAEMPGITPKVAEFARRVAGSRLHGRAAAPLRRAWPRPRPRRAPGPALHGHEHGAGLRLQGVHGVGHREDVTRHRLAAGARPRRARALRRPGRRASGMCFTGGFALAMATDERLLAPVLSQPSMPLALTPSRKATIDISLRGPRGREAAVRGRPRGDDEVLELFRSRLLT